MKIKRLSSRDSIVLLAAYALVGSPFLEMQLARADVAGASCDTVFSGQSPAGATCSVDANGNPYCSGTLTEWYPVCDCVSHFYSFWDCHLSQKDAGMQYNSAAQSSIPAMIGCVIGKMALAGIESTCALSALLGAIGWAEVIPVSAVMLAITYKCGDAALGNLANLLDPCCWTYCVVVGAGTSVGGKVNSCC